MARNRQRSKARQQQRREQRLAQRREAAALGGRPEEALDDGGTTDPDDPLELADLEVGAPPQDLGEPARTLRDEPPAPSFETDDEELGDGDGAAAAAGPRRVRGGPEGGGAP